MNRRKSEDDYAEGVSISMPKGLIRACEERRNVLGYGTLSEYFRFLARYVSGETEKDLKRIMEVSGMRQADTLRYVLTAALRVLAERDSVTLPIKFTVNTNGEHPKKK